MSDAPLRVRAAAPSDLAAVERLLIASELPLDGVREALATFVVAEAGSEIVGVAGLELCGEHALLRSVAVAGAWRSRGVGRELVTRVLSDADGRGIGALYLLTTTAERYFPGFGFRQVTRDEVPGDVRKTAEFRGACPETATIMSREAPVLRRLSTLDRFLPLWIFAAMGLGLLLGRAYGGLGAALDRVQVAGVSVPIGVGLIWMMYPVLAKVRYESIGQHVRETKLLGTSLVLNWVIGPLVMLGLAWIFLADMPEYRNGLVLIGLARCIAMVLIWNSLASGSGELAAVLVALNSVFQILTYSVLGWLFLTVVPGWFGADTTTLHVSMAQIARSVGIFLGVPLVAGYLTRKLLVGAKGAAWYDGVFMPRFGPTALVGLLYTIVLMFAMQGQRILSLPLDVLRIALPLLAYFAVMFSLAFWLARRLGFDYESTAALSFTAAGNNFELAIAVAVATFGIGSGEALAAVVGPLIEVPALVGLVYVSLWARRRFFPAPVPAIPAFGR